MQTQGKVLGLQSISVRGGQGTTREKDRPFQAGDEHGLLREIYTGGQDWVATRQNGSPRHLVGAKELYSVKVGIMTGTSM